MSPRVSAKAKTATSRDRRRSILPHEQARMRILAGALCNKTVMASTQISTLLIMIFLAAHVLAAGSRDLHSFDCHLFSCSCPGRGLTSVTCSFLFSTVAGSQCTSMLFKDLHRRTELPDNYDGVNSLAHRRVFLDANVTMNFSKEFFSGEHVHGGVVCVFLDFMVTDNGRAKGQTISSPKLWGITSITVGVKFEDTKKRVPENRSCVTQTKEKGSIRINWEGFLPWANFEALLRKSPCYTKTPMKMIFMNTGDLDSWFHPTCSLITEYILVCLLFIVYIWGSRWALSKQKKSKSLLLLVILAPMVIHQKSHEVHSAKPRNWHLEPYNTWADGIPSARNSHTMVRGADGLLYMFGGRRDIDGGLGSDSLIILDVETRRWSTITPSGPAPSARYWHGMVACGQSIYVFAGWNGPGSKSDDLDVLWRLSIQTLLWTETLLNATDSVPSPRVGHVMASVGDDIMVFGGLGLAGLSNELWRFCTKMLSWTLLDGAAGMMNTGPSARIFSAMVTVGNSMVVFGGDTVGVEIESDYSNEAWLLVNVRSHPQWTLVGLEAGVGPSARTHHAMAILGNNTVVFGGYIASGVSDETWILFNVTTSPLWILLVAQAGGGPVPSSGHAMVNVGNIIVVLGSMKTSAYNGEQANGEQACENQGFDMEQCSAIGCCQFDDGQCWSGVGDQICSEKVRLHDTSDLWRLEVSASSLTWNHLSTPVQATVGPSPRGAHTTTTVASDLILYGGVTASGLSSELWKLSSERVTFARVWTQVHPATGSPQPSPRHAHAMASVNVTVFLFGGSTSAGFSNELWKLEVVNTEWALLTGGEDFDRQIQPSARQFHAMASVGAMLFLFGGQTEMQRYCNELWSFDATQDEGWDRLNGFTHGIQPSARKGHTMNGVGSSLFVFGGETGRLWDNGFEVQYAELSSELWHFCTLQQKWALLNEAGEVHGMSPSARINQAAAAVETDLFVHGGQVVVLDTNGNYVGMESSDELFKFNSVTLVWIQLISAEVQVMQFGHTLTAMGSQLVLHGGKTGSGFSNETFTWTASVDFPSSFAALAANVHDGDTIAVKSGSPDVNWKWEADLCTRNFLPCSNLTITGDMHATSTIRRHASSKIACDAEKGTGCTGVTLQHVTVACDSQDVANEGPLQVSGKGAVLHLQSTVMSSCTAVEDGGSIRAFRSAKLIVTGSAFLRSSSQGNGGALALVGTTADIVTSSFVSCASLAGDGGALWASGDPLRYPLPVLPSYVNLTKCIFQDNLADSGFGGAMAIVMQSKCSLESSSFEDNSADSGGAMAISSESTVTLSKCDFSRNAATKSGGAMAMTAQSVVTIILSHLTTNSAAKGGAVSITAHSKVTIVSSHLTTNSAVQGGALISDSAEATIIGCDFVLNYAIDSGGALAVAAQSEAIIQGSHFVANMAKGLGGGAMHVSASFLQLLANTLAGNTAESGGGGALLWEGKDKEAPLVGMACALGFFIEEGPLIDGRADCMLCDVGTYTSKPGATTCTQCHNSMFQNETGASLCKACPAHSSSMANKGTTCLCDAGFSGDGVTTCTPCAPGTATGGHTTVTCAGNCPCEPSLGPSSGILSDGPGFYSSPMTCSWLISSTTSTDITVQFAWLNLFAQDSEVYDVITVYACASADCNTTTEKIAQLSGTAVNKNTKYTSSTGFLKVVFESSVYANDHTGGAGFRGVWRVVEQPVCATCPMGTYAAVPGTANCVICPAGKYQHTTGATACESCSANATTLASGSTNHLACLCHAGFFGNGVTHCMSCPAAHSSSRAGSTVDSACVCNTGYSGDITTGCIACVTNANSAPWNACACNTGYTIDGNSGAASCIVAELCAPGTSRRSGIFEIPVQSTPQFGSQSFHLLHGRLEAAHSIQACQRLEQDLSGKVALVKRSYECCFTTQAWHAQEAGARALIVLNHYGNDELVEMSATGLDWESDIEITAVFVGHSAGQQFLDLLTAGSAVDITMIDHYASRLGISVSNCAVCAAGTYANTAGASTCTVCPANTYQNATSTTVCTLCAANANSPVGSVESSACLCSQGSVGDGITRCELCAAGTYNPGTICQASGLSSAACSSYLALNLDDPPKFSSISSRDKASVGSTALPSYLAQGGPMGKGHVSFNRAQLQFLDGGPTTFNLGTNGGFTAVAVVRFTKVGHNEMIFASSNRRDDGYIELCRLFDSHELAFVLFDGSNACWVKCDHACIVSNSWMTIVARYDHQSETLEIQSNNEVVGSAKCSAALTDMTLSKTYVGKSHDEYFNGDIAGLFVVDEYLSTEAASLIANEIKRGMDLTKTVTECSRCTSGTYTNASGSSSCDNCPAITTSPLGSTSSAACHSCAVGECEEEKCATGKYRGPCLDDDAAVAQVTGGVPGNCDDLVDFVSFSAGCDDAEFVEKADAFGLSVPSGWLASKCPLACGWCAAPSDTGCSACPAGMTSLPGSTSSTDCISARRRHLLVAPNIEGEAGEMQKTAIKEHIELSSMSRLTMTSVPLSPRAFLPPARSYTATTHTDWLGSWTRLEELKVEHEQRNLFSSNNEKRKTENEKLKERFNTNGKLKVEPSKLEAEVDEKKKLSLTAAREEVIRTRHHVMKTKNSRPIVQREDHWRHGAVTMALGTTLPSTKVNIHHALQLLVSINHTKRTADSGGAQRRVLTSSSSSMPLPIASTLAELTHWLCQSGLAHAVADNNTAAYGPCVATPYYSLELFGLPPREEPGFAGITLELVVLKKDAYGQIVKSDSSSSLQLYSALDGAKINDPSVTYVGAIFSVFQAGIASFSVAVKPTFAVVSIVDDQTTLHRQPFLYVSGTDSARGAVMRIDVQQVHLSSHNRSACPIGFTLVLDSSSDVGQPGVCVQCAAGTYNVNPLTGVCLVCPPSATCLNGGPPIFDAMKTSGVIRIELSADSDDDTKQKALAAKLGVSIWQITLVPLQAQQRRAVQKVAFELVADKAQMTELVAQLTSLGAVLGVMELVGLQTAEGEVWEKVAGQFILRTCPLGNQLINTTDDGQLNVNAQRCSPCGVTTYIIDSLGSCQTCPKGASCPDGTQFLPTAVGSVWEDVVNANNEIQKRIVECPPGHALSREEDFPNADTCLPCKINTYRLERSFLNSTGDHCRTCEPKANCRGGNTVEAMEGYWRFQPVHWDETFEYLPGTDCFKENETCLFPDQKRGWTLFSAWKEPTMTCIKLPGGGEELFCARLLSVVNTIDSVRASVLRCPVGACGKNNSCLQNRTGPVCGKCLPGYVMETRGCSAKKCPPESELRPWRITLFTILCSFVFFAYVALAWRPVVPELDWLIAQMLQGVFQCLSSFVCFGDAQGDGSIGVKTLLELGETIAGLFGFAVLKAKNFIALAKQNHAPQFAKILVTYFQVLGSFTMFTIEWPDIALTMIVQLRGLFKFEVLQLPGLSCILQGYSSFEQTLSIYTIGPLVFMALCLLPVAAAVWRGYYRHSRDGLEEGYRWRHTLDKFWTNIMLVLFLVYPVVSIATMRAFNCDANLGLLKDDYNMLCPPVFSYLFIYSAGFFCLYPIGIPLFMNYSMVKMKMKTIVKEKMEKARFSAMLALFMKLACSVESQRVARLVGNVDDCKDEFERQTKKQFDKLLAIQEEEVKEGEGGEVGEDSEKVWDMLLVTKLRAKASANHAMDGVKIEELCTFFEKFDENGDGNVDLDEFRTMIKTCRVASNLFTGNEDLSHLTENQMVALLLFADWPKAHTGPMDTDDSGGLGGLVNVVTVEQSHKDLNAEEETPEHAHRRHALGDRALLLQVTDRELKKLDAIIAEIQELEEKKELSDYPNWKDDAERAETIYLEQPLELESWFQRMHIMMLNKQGKLARVIEKSEELVTNSIIAVPPEVWRVSAANDDPHKKPTEEEQIFTRLGFIFIAYRVDFWWFESVEMLRKFLITCFLVFLQGEGPSQLATGSLITFVFLLLNLSLRPYCTDGLNNLQTFSLVAQFLTLFCGILIGYDKKLNSENVGSADAGDKQDASVMGAMIVIINSSTLIWPLVRKILTGSVEEYWGHLKWILSLPFKFWMSCCGGNMRAKVALKKDEDARTNRRKSARHLNRTSVVPVYNEFGDNQDDQTFIRYSSLDTDRQMLESAAGTRPNEGARKHEREWNERQSEASLPGHWHLYHTEFEDNQDDQDKKCIRNSRRSGSKDSEAAPMQPSPPEAMAVLCHPAPAALDLGAYIDLALPDTFPSDTSVTPTSRHVVHFTM